MFCQPQTFQIWYISLFLDSFRCKFWTPKMMFHSKQSNEKFLDNARPCIAPLFL